jgi:hypothetical protein
MPHRTKKVAVIVHACDRYELLYRGFAYFFTKYWDFDIECNYYFATENLTVDMPGFQNIKSGKGAWSDRLAFLLTEKVKEDYVLYFQEDMWLDKKVDKEFFTELFKMAAYNQWKQVKLHSAKIYKTVASGHYVKNFNVAKVDKEQSCYLMSHQITLWDKEFLIKQLGRNEHPWRNERRATRRMRYDKTPIFHIDYFAENGATTINENRALVERSRYYTVSVNGTLNAYIESFACELRQGDSADRIYAKRLLFNFENHLTHDGQPKPRKIDFFKKIKLWFLSQTSSTNETP